MCFKRGMVVGDASKKDEHVQAERVFEFFFFFFKTCCSHAQFLGKSAGTTVSCVPESGKAIMNHTTIYHKPGSHIEYLKTIIHL